jgi:hypothetical protein
VNSSIAMLMTVSGLPELVAAFSRVSGRNSVQSRGDDGSGTVASIGYVGWSISGGYGPYSVNFGHGLEQILAAKVVIGKARLWMPARSY